MGTFQKALKVAQALMERIEKFPGSLGITRERMPQIDGEQVEEFLTWMRYRGFGVWSDRIPAANLKPTQQELNTEKVQSMIKTMPLNELQKHVIISQDNYLMDGHHRWAAILVTNPGADINVWRVNLPITELLTKANEFYGTYHQAA